MLYYNPKNPKIYINHNMDKFVEKIFSTSGFDWSWHLDNVWNAIQDVKKNYNKIVIVFAYHPLHILDLSIQYILFPKSLEIRIDLFLNIS